MNPDTDRRDCIFCGIASGRLPGSVAYEDADWIAVMDIHPIREGHVLIVPRRHAARLSELARPAQRALFALADRILHAQESAGYASGGGNLLLNDGIAANQHIPHLHLHCIPRRRGDTAGFGLRLLSRTFGLFGPCAARDRLDAAAAAIAARIRQDAAPPAGSGA